MADRQVFIDIIVACATRHACNGKLAAEALAREHSYEATAASFSILLALVYLDAGPAVARMLGDASAELMALFGDASVTSVVQAWSAAEGAADNPVTALLRFALARHAFAALAALVVDERLAEHISFPLYRTVTRAVAAELQNLEKQQRGADVLVAVDEDRLSATIATLEDGGTRMLRDALLIVAQFKERAAHAQALRPERAPPSAEDRRLDSEIERDRCRDAARRLARTAAEADTFLKRITNDALDLLQRQVLAERRHHHHNADDDIDDKRPAASALQELEHNIALYDHHKKLLPDAEPTFDNYVHSHTNLMAALRAHLELTQLVSRLTNRKLDHLETDCAAAQQADHDAKLADLKHHIALIDPDAYLQ